MEPSREHNMERERRTRRQLQEAFLLPLAVIMLATVVAGTVALTLAERDGVAARAYVVEKSVEVAYRQALDARAIVFKAAAYGLMARPELGDALAAGDRDALAGLVASTHEDLRRQFGVTRLEFHRPDRVNIYRAHAPDRFGDRVDRFTAREAQRTGAPMQGVELEADGTLSLRVVLPWPGPDGAPLGFVELGSGIDGVLAATAQVQGVRLPVLISKQRLTREQWEAGMRARGVAPDWDALPGLVLGAQGDWALPDGLLAKLRRSGAGGTMAFQEHGRSHLATSFPLDDAGGRHVGFLMPTADVTDLYASGGARVTLAVGVLLTLAVLVAWFFHFRTTTIAHTLAAQEARATHLATRDALTGLPNRDSFLDLIGAALAAADDDVVAVMVIDIDRLKTVNGSLGHQAGDRVLSEVASRVRSLVRETDTVARLGGDMFGVLIVGTHDAVALEALVRRVGREAGRPIDLGGDTVHLSCSVGVACFPDDATDAEGLVQRAAVAVQQAREGGVGGYRFFDAAMNGLVIDRMRLESSIHGALARGEFVLHYQPQVGVAQRAVVGAEALLRWAHPEWGMVGPDRFIPVLEETGLIGEVGMWTIKQACHDALGWQTPLRVAVNLSVVQLSDPAFIPQVRTVLDQLQMPRERLEFEITESVMMAHDDVAAANIAGIRELGIALALDDFGTGYSSLSYLKVLPAQVLKLDKSLVDDLDIDGTGFPVVEGVIWMARGMGLALVAEGIETVAQARALSNLGCDMLQGFLFSGPLPVDAFERFCGGFSWEAYLGADEGVPAPVRRAPAD